jgi:DNA recombination protein RmuC
MLDQRVEMQVVGGKTALSPYTGHIADVGKELDAAVRAYNKGVGSLERMVLPGVRRFTELGITPKKEIPPTRPIESALRTLQADTEEPKD